MSISVLLLIAVRTVRDVSFASHCEGSHLLQLGWILSVLVFDLTIPIFFVDL